MEEGEVVESGSGAHTDTDTDTDSAIADASIPPVPGTDSSMHESVGGSPRAEGDVENESPVTGVQNTDTQSGTPRGRFCGGFGGHSTSTTGSPAADHSEDHESLEGRETVEAPPVWGMQVDTGVSVRGTESLQEEVLSQ
jgi:hypothetical protein